jgi:hypothetical protein
MDDGINLRTSILQKLKITLYPTRDACAPELSLSSAACAVAVRAGQERGGCHGRTSMASCVGVL